MDEYRLEIKVKNNLIVKRIEESGYKTVGEFCRTNGLMNQLSHLGAIINMKESPLRSNGEWQRIILKCAELLNCFPEDFFTESQLHTILQTNKKHIEVKEAEMKFLLQQQNEVKLLEEVIDTENRDKAIDHVLNLLTERQRKIIEMRMGLRDYDRSHTFEEIGNEIGVGKERVRQIEAKALRKIRHPSLAEHLKEYF